MTPTRTACTAAALACAALGANAQGDCHPPRPTLLVERYLSADCAPCWSAVPPLPEGAAGRGRPFVLDWIVPGARGDAAPLAVAAVPEAQARVARAGVLRSDEALTQTTPLAARSELRVEARDGPAFKGYIGLQFDAAYAGARPLPPGLTGWLALVERVAAGSEGTPVERTLVRTLVGPLPLDELPARHAVRHLRAARVPENAKPERLSVVAWVETRSGKVLAVAARHDPDCDPPAPAQ
ncbi:MAG TPA: hypothetical protein VLU41_13440 [Ideonella sp.]|nr:hypothetical protein [Ideonella sp.]